MIITNDAERKAIKELSVKHHGLRIVVSMLDTNHNHIGDLTERFYDGQVSVDTGSETSRGLDLMLLDPFRTLHLEPNSPSDTGVFVGYMIRTTVQLLDYNTNKTYNIPTFTGPIDDIERDEVFITLKCLGKEALFPKNMWKSMTFKGKPNIVKVMRQILLNLGETNFDIPDDPKKSSKPIHLDMDDNPFALLKKLANELGRVAFYDARGVFVCRPMPGAVSWQFTKSNTRTPFKVGYDMQNVCNAVKVIGGKSGKRDKTVPTAIAYPPKTHPLHPWSEYMKRGGQPRFINPVVIKDGSLRTQKAVNQRARKYIDNSIQSNVEVTGDAWPQYMLEPYDLGEIDVPGAHHDFRLSKFAFPLRASGVMPIGYLKRTEVKGGPQKKGKGNKGKGGKGKDNKGKRRNRHDR